jgi:hypothetical protein
MNKYTHQRALAKVKIGKRLDSGRVWPRRQHATQRLDADNGSLRLSKRRLESHVNVGNCLRGAARPMRGIQRGRERKGRRENKQNHQELEAESNSK